MAEHYLQGKWQKEKLFLQIQSINIMYPNAEHDYANNKRNGYYYEYPSLSLLMGEV